MIVFSYATSKGVHFTSIKTMETSEFIERLNEFIAVRSRSQEIESDNASTFKAEVAWIKKLMQSEELHEYLEYHSIKWDFILPKEPMERRILGKNLQGPKNHAVAEIGEKLFVF